MKIEVTSGCVEGAELNADAASDELDARNVLVIVAATSRSPQHVTSGSIERHADLNSRFRGSRYWTG